MPGPTSSARRPSRCSASAASTAAAVYPRPPPIPPIDLPDTVLLVAPVPFWGHPKLSRPDVAQLRQQLPVVEDAPPGVVRGCRAPVRIPLAPLASEFCSGAGDSWGRVVISCTAGAGRRSPALDSSGFHKRFILGCAWPCFW